MNVQTVRLEGNCGVEVRDLDLSKPLDAEVTAQLDDLLGQHGVLLFRGQFLSEDDLVRFASAFGQLETSIYTKGVSPYNPEVIYISNLKYPDGSNVGLLGDGELHWHSDQTYRTRPATGSMLYGLEVTTTSGCTYWANQYLAYESLLATEEAEKAGVADRVTFVAGDLFVADVEQATVVTLYLLPSMLGDVETKLRKELKPGTRIVSHDYPLPSWKPVEVVKFDTPEKVLISGSARTVYCCIGCPISGEALCCAWPHRQVCDRQRALAHGPSFAKKITGHTVC